MYSPYDDQNKNNLSEAASEAGQEKSQGASPPAAGYGTGSYPYTAQTGGQGYYSQPPQQPRPAQYTWGTAQQPGGFYQGGGQPPKPPKEKKRGGKFGLKLLAAVLCCAVVSLGSVGVFAALIQNGVVAVQSPEGAESTAAFTLYKLEGAGKNTTPTATAGEMTSQEVAQKLIPSVVCVQNYQISQQSIMFGGIEYAPAEGGEVSPAGEGSGIIFSKDGYIVTNQHVIDGATKIKVVTHDGMSYEAELIGEDTQTDLAVLKIEADQELTPAEFGSSEDLQVTDTVMAIGNPGGIQFNSSVTMGYVSALNRQITNGDTGFTLNCIQTDAAINPGNSGGALVDMKGHVVGINSSKIVATGYEGLGFAIPSDTVQPIVSDLIEYGYVKDRAALGISVRYIDKMNAMWYGLTPGCHVYELLTENASKSGLQQGDVITAIDDTQITSGTTVSAFLATKKPGETVTLTVDRAMTGESGLQIELVLSENSGVSAKRQEN
ncbi:PDZ domain-containing protein [Neglecta sp. X4]|uniref:S1C family serine protease n=1 Tax=unclassified Neglectibacter TaxID=2632164 RepID=UPI00136A96FC|nr:MULTISPECIES: trypsin-like peptidase domain-containing protein [unclassified Neglectibacter]NBI16737.1 PDZ domain-containing protein [Neglectibacter sp. 59]NBJ72152.1 PDZ domain-containing protein [Neglectibacter sp. X4]NCE80096.1 PDZ domain-containing protein [Neglectibacter sp. X58]